jgi:hypothetical protein
MLGIVITYSNGEVSAANRSQRYTHTAIVRLAHEVHTVLAFQNSRNAVTQKLGLGP